MSTSITTDKTPDHRQVLDYLSHLSQEAAGNDRFDQAQNLKVVGDYLDQMRGYLNLEAERLPAQSPAKRILREAATPPSELAPPPLTEEVKELLTEADVDWFHELDPSVDPEKGWIISESDEASAAFDRITQLLYAEPGLWDEFPREMRRFEEQGRWTDLEQLAADWSQMRAQNAYEAGLRAQYPRVSD